MKPALRRRALLVVAGLCLLVGAPLVTLGLATTAHADETGPVTVTQTDPTHYAYIPAVKKTKTNPGHPAGTETVAPSVTVSQTSNLVYQTVQVNWQNFTPSFDSTGATTVSDDVTYYGVKLFECKGTDPTVPPNPFNDNAPEDCYAQPTAQPLLGQHGLGNAVSAFTAPDGTGEANITIETATENDLLGCSQTQPCSLVVVPNWGGEQLGSKINCAVHKQDTSNSGTGQALLNAAGAPCSWADRITVPLTFEATPANCTGTAGFSSEGSPMLQEAMARWRPSWCNGTHPLTLNFDSGTTEAQAREDFTTAAGALSETTDAAFTSRPATAEQTKQRAFTYAPVANTGIVIAFVIDDPTTGQQITHLNLDARLVAKLLTESYSLGYSSPVCEPGAPTASQTGCGDYDNGTGTYSGHQVPCTSSMPQSVTCDPAVAGNPRNIVTDPEFQALNPSLFPPGQPAKISQQYLALGQFLPIFAGGDTDVTYALTNWIESDPDARAFLAGAQDGFGMHVNSYYKDVDWPSDEIQALDPGYSDRSHFPGFGTMQVASNPVDGLSNTVQSLLASQPTDIDTVDTVPTPCNSGTDPTNTDPPCYLARQSPLPPGGRVLFAVMDAGDASNFGFPTADLVNPAGVAVGADTTSVGAAIHDVTPNADGITTSPSYTEMASDPAAYPLAVTDYAMVPTCKASKATATSLATFLDLDGSSAAQTNGYAVGQLTPGYTPLTPTQTKQTASAAELVAAQTSCAKGIAPPATTKPTGTKTTSPSSTGGTGTSGSSGGGFGSGGGTGGSTGGGSSSTTTSAAAKELPPNTPAAEAEPGTKALDGAGPVVLMIVLMAVGAVVLLAAGPGTWWVTSTSSGAAAFARLRRVIRP